MKTFLVFALLSFSLNAFACPQIAGTFFDADNGVNLLIAQDGCATSTWSDGDGSTTLIADNVERVLQAEGSVIVYAKIIFTNTDLVLDMRVDYGAHNEFDLPVRFITSYRIDKFNNLVEKIEPFAADGSAGATEYVTFRRVK